MEAFIEFNSINAVKCHQGTIYFIISKDQLTAGQLL